MPPPPKVNPPVEPSATDAKSAKDFAGIYGGNNTAPVRARFFSFDIDLTVKPKGSFELFVDTVDRDNDGWRILWEGVVVRGRPCMPPEPPGRTVPAARHALRNSC